MSKATLVLIGTLFISSAGMGSCLPAIELMTLPADHTRCQQSSDCEIAGDACRSCQKPYAINTKYGTQFKELDFAARTKANCILSCEACAPKQKPSCIKGKCQI
jgi:hypothetical protein